jgi:hypothetical protein
MKTTTPAALTVYKGSPLIILSRVLDWNGLLVTKAALTSISLSVFLVNKHSEDDDEATAIVDEDVPVDAAVFDTLQVDRIWQESGGDKYGYNFYHMIAETGSSPFTKRQRTYRCVYSLVPTAGPIIPLEPLVSCV